MADIGCLRVSFEEMSVFVWLCIGLLHTVGGKAFGYGALELRVGKASGVQGLRSVVVA